MVNRELQYDNSFTLKFTNTTNTRRKVILFSQGGDTQFNVTQVNSADENGSQGNITQSALIWNFVGGQPYQYNATTTPVTSPIDIDLFKATTTGTLEIISDNGGSKADVAILNTDTLNQVNDKINATIRLNADLTNFLSPSGKYAEVNVFFDINYFEQFPLPQPKTNPPYRQSFGVSVQYPTDLPHKLLQLNYPTNANSEFGTLNTMNEVVTSSANGVVVEDSGSNITYDEILRSQNGAVYDIISMSLDIGKTPTILEAKSQMLQPLCYDKRNANGDSITYCQTPTIDPYQFQNSYSVIDMASDEDNYVLDGNTEFIYSVEPLSTAILTFNYTKLTNLVGDTRLGISNMRKEQERIKKWDAQRGMKAISTINIPSSRPKSKKNFNNFSNETETKVDSVNTRAFSVMVGVGFLFFIYQLNQTN